MSELFWHWKMQILQQSTRKCFSASTSDCWTWSMWRNTIPVIYFKILGIILRDTHVTNCKPYPVASSNLNIQFEHLFYFFSLRSGYYSVLLRVGTKFHCILVVYEHFPVRSHGLAMDSQATMRMQSISSVSHVYLSCETLFNEKNSRRVYSNSMTSRTRYSFFNEIPMICSIGTKPFRLNSRKFAGNFRSSPSPNSCFH
jgi:hypothetical protein